MNVLTYGETSRNKLFHHEQKPKSTKDRFMIYAVSNCGIDYREQAADALTEIATVDQGGKCWGRKKLQENTTSTTTNKLLWQLAPPQVQSSHWYMANSELFGMYRFCLVMESKFQEGYMTEKILNAFLSGCIPIYYGPEEIFDIFNKDAFVYYNVSNPQSALDHVRYLEENATAYDQVMAQPILANGKRTIDEYFSWTEDIGDGSLKRRLRAKMGID
jgi:hypothetical protein